MAVGDLIRFNDGYQFYETFHGPFELTSCVDCGHSPIAAAGRKDDGPWPPPGVEHRCSGCARQFHGLE